MECESNVQWSLLGLGSEKKVGSVSEDCQQGEWDKMAEKMLLTLEESGSEPRVHRPEVSSRDKATENLSTHYCADQDTITTFAQLLL